MSFICQGYLAFPRMGRSQGQSETAEGVASCCGLGLKSEFVVGQNGKEELDVVCAAKAGCCEGLREVVDQSPTGSSYFLCVPESLFHQDTVSHKRHNTISSVWFGRFQEFFLSLFHAQGASESIMTTDRLVAEEAEVHQEMVLDGLRRWCSKRDGARSLALSLSL